MKNMKQFGFCLKELDIGGGRRAVYYSLAALEAQGLGAISRMPFSVKILLESLVRMQGHPAYQPEQVLSLCRWNKHADPRTEYPFLPSRVLLQDFTGVPCVVDLAALRSALARTGQNPGKIEPLIPVDLVIDHSVQIDCAGSAASFECNLKKEFERNRERYVFLRWGQDAFRKLRVLPPGLGICHQVNMEYLATCVNLQPDGGGRLTASPDTLVGTDSHTVMINSMGVLGWGVGGIEAEAAMLGQPIPILSPSVLGFRLTGRPGENVTSTDIALTITQMLRKKGVVGSFVEYFGEGLDHLSLPERAPIANMAPEYGATMGFFPIDGATLDYLRQTGRSEDQVRLVEAYCREQGLFRTPGAEEPEFTDVIELDLSSVEPCMAGPKRPHDRIAIQNIGREFSASLAKPAGKDGFGVPADETGRKVPVEGMNGELEHGSVVIAAITSCTNTAGPALMLGAGLMAKKAVEFGLKVPPQVKASLAPGSQAVTGYLKAAGLLEPLEKLGFFVDAYGCGPCIGNSGPLAPAIEKAVRENDLVAAAVLSGNRNFEGRVHPLTKANYLGSPLLVLAYALKGTVKGEIQNKPVGKSRDGRDIYLKDLWPSREELEAVLPHADRPDLYKEAYGDIAGCNPMWNELPAPSGTCFEWDAGSTYIQEPPFFKGFAETAPGAQDIPAARVLGFFGDFITTDHISPAGSIPAGSPAENFLLSKNISRDMFNSFGSRRGNHEVMMRGTFGNIRIRNRLASREGGFTRHLPDGEEMSFYDAAMRYLAEGQSLVVLAGKMYGAGSSRDWAAKGTALLGVKAVIAESYERIHRSNLVEMGVLPLQFIEGQNADSLGLTGRELFSIGGIAEGLVPGKLLTVRAAADDGKTVMFKALCRIDAPIEVEYFRHGGILQYVLRNMMKNQ